MFYSKKERKCTWKVSRQNWPLCACFSPLWLPSERVWMDWGVSTCDYCFTASSIRSFSISDGSYDRYGHMYCMIDGHYFLELCSQSLGLFSALNTCGTCDFTPPPVLIPRVSKINPLPYAMYPDLPVGPWVKFPFEIHTCCSFCPLSRWVSDTAWFTYRRVHYSVFQWIKPVLTVPWGCNFESAPIFWGHCGV